MGVPLIMALVLACGLVPATPPSLGTSPDVFVGAHAETVTMTWCGGETGQLKPLEGSGGQWWGGYAFGCEDITTDCTILIHVIHTGGERAEYRLLAKEYDCCECDAQAGTSHKVLLKGGEASVTVSP